MTSPVDAAEGDPLDGAAPPLEQPIVSEAPPTPPEEMPAIDRGAVDDRRDRRDRPRLRGLARSERDADEDRARASAPDVAAAICPYLASAGGSWRMAVPSRDHRCLGLTPPSPQPVEKQRRHCLAAEHVECSIFRAAREARATALAGAVDPARIAIADARRRAIPRTAPVLLEPPRLIDQVTRFQLDRTPGQLALVGLMVIAFAFVALTRLSAGSAGPGPSAPASLIAIVPSGSALPSATIRASIRAASPSPSTSPGASFRTTYTVKKGDTLATIATRFKTTAAAIRTLNNLKSTSLKVGQVLKIP